VCKYKIYQGDNIEILKEKAPDECIDMVLTSPPYGDLRDYDGYSFNFEKLANELYKVLKPGGVIVWIVKDKTENGSETGTSFEQALYFKKIGFRLHDTMIYRKAGISYPDTVRYYDIFEYMFIFSKGKPKTINLLKDRKNKTAGDKNTSTERKKDGTLVKQNSVKKGRITPKYGIRYNIWKYSIGKNKSAKDKIAHEHPAIFPEKLAEDHIKTWSKEGDWILDPMAGSGTVLKMSYLNNRNSIGIDCSKKYCDLMKERMKIIVD